MLQRVSFGESMMAWRTKEGLKENVQAYFLSICEIGYNDRRKPQSGESTFRKFAIRQSPTTTHLPLIWTLV